VFLAFLDSIIGVLRGRKDEETRAPLSRSADDEYRDLLVLAGVERRTGWLSPEDYGDATTLRASWL
jgi:hypothetical protein